MNLLIVDDEYYSAESTRKKIAGGGLNVSRIFCAYNMAQALECMAEHEISILILDIEMPGGSGLELLEQIRKKDMDVICIFLTAYAKFEYASKAMRLASMDYLLKPVAEEELLLAVRRALEQRVRQDREKQRREEAGYWRESELSLWELFWMNLASGAVSDRPEDIRRELVNRKLNPEAADASFLLLLVELRGMDQATVERDLQEFLLKNILREYFYDKEETPAIVRLDRKFYLLPLPEEGRGRQRVIDRCGQALSDFVPRFPNAFNFYVAASGCRLTDFYGTVEELLGAADGNVALENQVIDLSEQQFGEAQAQEGSLFDLRRWSDYLLSGRAAALRGEAELLLGALPHSQTVTKETLLDFYYSFLQMLLHCMEISGEDRLPGFRRRLSGLSGEQACASVRNLKEWTREACALYEECAADQTNQGAAVEQVKRYIREHLDQDMTRESLAALVYLTPDYLSHLFKRETGFALNNYVIYERIMEAKRLLAGTKRSVSEVAAGCGFQNISYFSRQFKRFTGMTPREFRR